MKQYLIIVIMLSAFTITATAQETEDVVYLKNGSVIRGTITELTPNTNLKIRTRDGSLFVFEMDEVERVAKESRQVQTQQTLELEDAEATISLNAQESAFGGLLLGAHSKVGMGQPFIGAMGFYDTEIDLKALSNQGAEKNRIGFIGSVGYSFGDNDNILLGSAHVCLGFKSSENSTFRLGTGASFSSIEGEFAGLDARSEFGPSVIGAWTVHPKTEDRESFALTVSARWQGDGVIFAATFGLLQRGGGL